VNVLPDPIPVPSMLQIQINKLLRIKATKTEMDWRQYLQEGMATLSAQERDILNNMAAMYYGFSNR
jgi:hypothetical protein